MVPAHVDKINALCGGKQACMVRPTAADWQVGVARQLLGQSDEQLLQVTCTKATKKLWLQWSCGPVRQPLRKL